MVKYFLGTNVMKSSWDQVIAAFWKRYPNPYSKHVLSEDVLYREVTPDNKLLTRKLLTKTNRLPHWAERFFPSNVTRAVYIIEDSIVDPVTRTLTTFTWNINHAKVMSVEERCIYCENPENGNWTNVKREAWISSKVLGFTRPIQEFGLARFRSNVTKAIKGYEYILTKMQDDALLKTLVETAKDATGKAKETALAARDRAKGLANKTTTTKKQQYL
uniref:PRELI domain containing 1 n=1 Tax=Leptobrachium leishanense TaxID=445787 RepID=A0A8C5M6K5_9ANUR